jgi:hypothetical protein
MNPTLIKYGVALVVFVAALVGAYVKGHAAGKLEIRAEWQADTLRRDAAQKVADDAQQKRFDALAETYRLNNIGVSNDHQKAVNKLQADLARARADVRAAGGLRIPASVCPGNAQGGAQAGSDGRHDADPAGTVALPEQTSLDLLELAAEADRVTEIARTCQAWVRKHGFYDEVFKPSP